MKRVHRISGMGGQELENTIGALLDEAADHGLEPAGMIRVAGDVFIILARTCPRQSAGPTQVQVVDRHGYPR